MSTLGFVRTYAMWIGMILLTSGSWVRAEALVLEPDSVISLSGDSTLHPFTAQTQQIQMKTTLDPAAPTRAGVLEKGALRQFDLSIPVQSLKSKEPKLDKNMYKALNAEACPSIEFSMNQYDVVGSTVRAQGTLRIACHEQKVLLTGLLQPDSDNLSVKGQYDLKMTDYGVKPPTMMMGAIKVKNEVTIHFDIRLR